MCHISVIECGPRITDHAFVLSQKALRHVLVLKRQFLVIEFTCLDEVFRSGNSFTLLIPI